MDLVSPVSVAKPTKRVGEAVVSGRLRPVNDNLSHLTPMRAYAAGKEHLVAMHGRLISEEGG